MYLIRAAISFLTNPIFSVFYLFTILVFTLPQSFGIKDVLSQPGGLLMIKIGITSVFLPFLAIILLKALGFTPSIKLEKNKERIVPYVIVATFYLWVFINISKTGGFPMIFKTGILAFIIALFICFLINLQIKISAHIAGMASLVIFLFLNSNQIILNEFYWGGKTYSLGIYPFMGLILLTGLLGAIRNWDNKRGSEEIYWPAGIALISQIIASKVIYIFLFVNNLYMMN